MNLKLYFSFTGRLNRKAFLIFYMKLSLVLLTALILSLFEGSLMRIITILFSIFIVFPLCIAGAASFPVKRLHDINFSGKWFLIGVGAVSSLDIILRVIYKISPKQNTDLLENITFILFIPVFICWLVLCFKKGVKGKNKYGDDPLSL